MVAETGVDSLDGSGTMAGMEFYLTGPSNPWWLTYVAGFGIAALVLTWRVWWFVAKVVFAVYYVAALRLLGVK
jgi:hypothetical protein